MALNNHQLSDSGSLQGPDSTRKCSWKQQEPRDAQREADGCLSLGTGSRLPVVSQLVMPKFCGGKCNVGVAMALA